MRRVIGILRSLEANAHIKYPTGKTGEYSKYSVGIGFAEVQTLIDDTTLISDFLHCDDGDVFLFYRGFADFKDGHQVHGQGLGQEVKDFANRLGGASEARCDG